jgi:hypothetical protein
MVLRFCFLETLEEVLDKHEKKKVKILRSPTALS